MVGMVRDDDLDSGDVTADDLVLNDSISGKGGSDTRRDSRRTLEEVLEERRLKRQLRDVFSEDDWDD